MSDVDIIIFGLIDWIFLLLCLTELIIDYTDKTILMAYILLPCSSYTYVTHYRSQFTFIQNFDSSGPNI